MTKYRGSRMNNRYHIFGWLTSSTWVVFTDRARPPQFPSWSVTVAVKFTKFSRNCAQETQSERVKASDVHNEITLLWGVLVSPFVDIFCFQYIFEEAARRVVASPITTVNIDKNLFSWNVKRCPMPRSRWKKFAVLPHDSNIDLGHLALQGNRVPLHLLSTLALTIYAKGVDVLSLEKNRLILCFSFVIVVHIAWQSESFKQDTPTISSSESVPFLWSRFSSSGKTHSPQIWTISGSSHWQSPHSQVVFSGHPEAHLFLQSASGKMKKKRNTFMYWVQKLSH